MQENLKIVHPARRRARANLPGKGGDHPGKRGRRISDTHETETEREEEEEEEDAIQTEESYTLQVKICEIHPVSNDDLRYTLAVMMI